MPTRNNAEKTTNSKSFLVTVLSNVLLREIKSSLFKEPSIASDTAKAIS